MLGARIAALREQRGWSQAELARRLNISPSTVGMYEQGRREPSVDMLVAISRIFCVSTEYLLTGQVLKRQEILRASGRSLRQLSREELLVLLTASLLGEEAYEE